MLGNIMEVVGDKLSRKEQKYFLGCLEYIHLCIIYSKLPWGFKFNDGPDNGNEFGLDAKPKPDAPERFLIESMYQIWPRLVA